MINIYIESFKLLLNEINQIENKNSFIIIREDALLSKGVSNEETKSEKNIGAGRWRADNLFEAADSGDVWAHPRISNVHTAHCQSINGKK